MPGGGKSTVGRQLAKRIGARFLDSDAFLEERIGMPIRSSSTASASRKRAPRRRANCRPTVDLPPPGKPTRETTDVTCAA